MVKFLITNDINDINQLFITHFSLDKGYYLAKSFATMGHDVYFLTNIDDYELDNIKYISLENITDELLAGIDYVLISREALFVRIIENVPSIGKSIALTKMERIKPKYIIKSDTPLWYYDKEMRRHIHEKFQINMSKSSISRWVIQHIDFICAQNTDYKQIALENRIPGSTLLISGMGIPNQPIDYNQLVNPYDTTYSYCVDGVSLMGNKKALWPLYYVNHPEKKSDLFKTKKYIIVYTGRIKVDGGKILFNMRNVMNILGGNYELHIFPGSFIIPVGEEKIIHSARNAHSLGILRDTIFKDNKNIFVHYPYEHKDKYQYLHFADCGIDFSDIRPHASKCLAGHAKLLEYCEIGLPTVCEENINNLDLIRRGRSGIILPYLASDEDYADAIKKVIHEMKFDRQYCRKVTIENENWDIRAKELLEQLKLKSGV